MYLKEKKKLRFQHWGAVVESLNMLLAIATIVFGVFIFLNLDEMMQWLPAVFIMGALVNLTGALKAVYYGRKWSGLGLLLAAVFIFIFAAVSYIAFWC